MEINEMNFDEIEKRMSEIKAELENENADIDALDSEVTQLEERKNVLKKSIEQRQALIQKVANGEGVIVEKRTTETNFNEVEKRANEFAKTGRMEKRAILSTGKIAKPAAAGGVNGLAEVASDIVDDVNAIELTGNGTWEVGYQKTNAAAADVVDGSDVAGTAATFDTVKIAPAEWAVFDTVSKQVKKMTPVNYMGAVETAALSALRAKGSDKIVAAIKASALTEKRTAVALDQDYLRNLVLGFRAVKNKGSVCLYIAQEDLATLGKVRGTTDKKAVYEISFDADTTTSGTIKEGGTITRFRILDQLTKGTQLFGQPMTIDMPMWDNYEISTDEGGEFFKKNVIGVRGLQTANADLVVFHGMQLITQA